MYKPQNSLVNISLHQIKKWNVLESEIIISKENNNSSNKLYIAHLHLTWSFKKM